MKTIYTSMQEILRINEEEVVSEFGQKFKDLEQYSLNPYSSEYYIKALIKNLKNVYKQYIQMVDKDKDKNSIMVDLDEYLNINMRIIYTRDLLTEYLSIQSAVFGIKPFNDRTIGSFRKLQEALEVLNNTYVSKEAFEDVTGEYEDASWYKELMNILLRKEVQIALFNYIGDMKKKLFRKIIIKSTLLTFEEYCQKNNLEIEPICHNMK